MPQERETRSKSTPTSEITRRRLVAAAGAAATLAVVRPQTARAYAANAKIDLGIIGCGGRGTWIAELFRQNGGYNIVAAADYFEDRVTAAGNKFDIKSANRFSGLSGYRRLLEQKLDAVAIETPPYFHPEQAAAGVEAGKHVYVAKPIAVDVPGCNTIGQSGKKATEKKLCFIVDFQTRSTEFFIEAIKRVHDGGIGKLAFGEATYHADIPWMGQIASAKDAKNPESRLRAWGLSKILSGDIIVEQNIHTLDVASWIMNQTPVCAYGTGGQKVRDFGDCWDTFSVVYIYPNNVAVDFSSRQFNGHDTRPEGIRNRMFGSDGVLETEYGGQVLVRGKNFYRGGRTPGIYQEGAVANIAAFHKAIQAGDCTNPTVDPSVRSNLLAILGRAAAYKGEVVRWEQLVKSDERLEADLKGLKN